MSGTYFIKKIGSSRFNKDRVNPCVRVVVDETEVIAPLCKRELVLLVHQLESDHVTPLFLFIITIISYGVLQGAKGTLVSTGGMLVDPAKQKEANQLCCIID